MKVKVRKREEKEELYMKTAEGRAGRASWNSDGNTDVVLTPALSCSDGFMFCQLW